MTRSGGEIQAGQLIDPGRRLSGRRVDLEQVGLFVGLVRLAEIGSLGTAAQAAVFAQPVDEGFELSFIANAISSAVQLSGTTRTKSTEMRQTTVRLRNTQSGACSLPIIILQ
jgi:hypothetical protein